MDAVCRITNDSCACVHIFGDDGTGTDNRFGADSNTGKHYGSDTYECIFLDQDFTCETCARPDMNAVAEHAIVVDGCRSIDDDCAAQSRIRTDRCLCQYMTALA